MFTHPYAMLSRGRETTAPWEHTVLPKYPTSPPSVLAPVDCWKVTSQNCFIPT